MSHLFLDKHNMLIKVSDEQGDDFHQDSADYSSRSSHACRLQPVESINIKSFINNKSS